MRHYRTWHGVDASNSESLFEYGFLIRWNAKYKMYDAIFAVGYNDNGEATQFVYDSFDADDWRDTLKEDSDLQEIADMCGMNADTYLDDVTDTSLLSDLLSYYGATSIADCWHTWHTTSEVRKRLNKALD